MKIDRRFTTEETGAYGALAFRTTTSEIRNPDGSVVFSLDEPRGARGLEPGRLRRAGAEVLPQGRRARGA